MLFGEVDPGTQTGIAMTLTTLIGTGLGYLFGYLKERDKLRDDADKRRYDAEFLSLKAKDTFQAAQIERLTKAQQDCETRHQECQDAHRETERRLKEIESAVTQLRHPPDHKTQGDRSC